MMTVAQLRHALATMPDEMPVVILAPETDDGDADRLDVHDVRVMDNGTCGVIAVDIAVDIA